MTIDYALIAARSRNSVIGRDDEIPWHVKGEQALFKKITLGGCLLMGRRTFESIGRALPGRISIVITRQQDYSPEGCHVAHTLEAAFHSAEQTKRPIFVIGGGELYASTLAQARWVHLTTIDLEVNGNVYFPPFPTANFTCIHTEHFQSNHAYCYQTFERNPTENV